jgi:predicted dinucleotide-binding enzyme
MNNQRCVGIIGCGNMGFALARRLTLSGYTVLMGSRNPDLRHDLDFKITSIPDCINRSSIIFIAIHAEYYTNVLISPLEHNPTLFDGKILIDISNQLKKKPDEEEFSNAERLQTAIPNAYIVKAFNTISSFVMDSTTAGEPRSVFVASDYPSARDKVIMLAREMNFESYNGGSLRMARYLESYTRSLFPLWRIALIIALIVLFIWLNFTIYMKFINTKTTSWHQLFLSITNKVLCSSAITMLALVYMPSNLACIFQLAYGTRERRFPIWLDKWLLSRKQLGLLTFAIGLCHAFITLIIISPAYYATWYHPVTVIVSPVHNQTKIVVQTGLMSWKGELASLMGILTLFTMSLLALASIPALGNLLNWREWRFIQSKLGTVTLLFAIGHVFAMATPGWIQKGFVKSLYSVGFLCVFFPVITILMKFLFWLPCLSRPIRRIRRGEKRKAIPII